MIKNYIIHILSYLFTVFIPYVTISQPVNYEISRDIRFSVPFISDPQSYNKNGNEILIEMAKEVLKEPWKVGIEIYFNLQISISGNISDKMFMVFTSLKPQITGDIHYRLFDISDVLFPSRMNCRIRVDNKTDSSMLHEKVITNRRFGISDTLVTGQDWLYFNPATDTITLSSIELFYDEKARNEFFSRLNQINDYYACRSLLDSLNLLAQLIDLKEGSMLPINYIRIREIDHAIHLMETRKFPETILTQVFDPRNWKEVFTATDKYSRSLTFTFEDELMNSGAIPWSGNLDTISDYFTARVHSYIRLSQKMSEINGGIYTDWLDKYFQFSAFDNEISLIRLMARKMFPDASQDTILTYVSSKIYHAYQRLAIKLMNQNQYAEAFALMEHASHFATGNGYFPQGLNENEVISKAARGIFDSYVGIAKTCLMNQKYAMADNYLAKAAGYREDHIGYLFSDSLYNSVSSELFFQRNTECDELLLEKRFAEALVCYLYFEESYDSLQLAAIRMDIEQKKRNARYGLFIELTQRTSQALNDNLPDSVLFYFYKAKELESELMDVPDIKHIIDSLDPLVVRISYDRMLQSGATAVSQRNFIHAIEEFSQAKDFAEQYHFPFNTTSDSLYRQAVKQNLLIDLGAYQQLIWSNQFDSARAHLEKMRQTASLFNLSEDADIQRTFMLFLARIGEQKCRNLGDTLQLQLIRSDRNRALKNYLKSVSILRQVRAIAENSPDCHFPVIAIQDSIVKYENPALYQQRLEEASRNLVSGQYQRTVSILVDNEKLYQTDDLNRFGLSPVTLYEYALNRGNPYLTEQAIVYFYGISDFQEAIRYLHLLRRQGYPEHSVNDTQDQIGRRMANADVRKNSKADPILLVDIYTARDPWFNIFRSSYIDEWNKLIKAMQPIR